MIKRIVATSFKRACRIVSAVIKLCSHLLTPPMVKRLGLRPASRIATVVILACFDSSAFNSSAVATETGQTDSSHQEAAKLQEFMKNRPDQSTAPVDFSVGGVRYRVPRNYLLRMDNWSGGPQDGVTLRVATPSFKPFSKENEACFAKAYATKPAGCSIVDFDIELPTMKADADLFENAIRVSPYKSDKLNPKPGPFGYELYEHNTSPNGVKIYRKFLPDGRALIFNCYQSSLPGSQAAHGVCATLERLPSSAILHFYFPLSQFGDAQLMDGRLRPLVNSFTLRKGEK